MVRAAVRAAVLGHTLYEIDPQYPTVAAQTRAEMLAEKAKLEAEAPKGAEPDPFEAAVVGEGRQRGRSRKKPSKHRG